MLRRFAFAALFAAACSSGSAHAPDGGTADLAVADAGGAGDLALSPWKLTWSDEFNGPAGPIDATKWGFDVGTGSGGWGNNELEYYTNRTDNVVVDGSGALEIIARSESYMGSAYTSGRINTSGKFSQAYGRFEARIQIAQGKGIWPAFWTLGDNIGSAGWPGCGELDIQETVGPTPAVNHGSAHGPGYSILNLAVGGNFPGPPDGTTQFPQTTKVEYVRVYEQR